LAAITCGYRGDEMNTQQGLNINDTGISLSVSVETDSITTEISKMFDYEFDGRTNFKCKKIKVPEDYQIGLIVGPSGSGKSTLLKTIGQIKNPKWEYGKAIVSHFEDAKEAQKRLTGVGFNSIPSWLRPYSVLSTGEKFRADMAKSIETGSCIDEFTSVVDRTVAKSCSFALNRLIRNEGIRNVTLASCHYDIIEWLQPDWIYDTNLQKFLHRGSLRCPDRIIKVEPCGPDLWEIFSHHHYLSGNLGSSARCWIAKWDGQAVGFAAAIAFPSGTVKNAWRGHRTVVLPDFQGMGFGVRISDSIGEIFIRAGNRYFSKTAHPRMGEYRNLSNRWKPTSKNMKSRPDYSSNRKTKESGHKHLHIHRVTYSHEYIGGV